MSAAVLVDAVLHAVADPRRRALFERIARARGISVTDLTTGSGVTQGAVSPHLKILRDAGLVGASSHGRQMLYRAQPGALQPLADWLTAYERFWTERMASLRVLVAEMDDE